MKKIKVSEATDMQLDWLVGVCEHGEDKVLLYRRDPIRMSCKKGRPIPAINDPDGDQWARYLEYTTNWSQMGPINDRESIEMVLAEGHHESAKWMGVKDNNVFGFGQTQLVAAARCYVASKLGDTVEVPEELT